MKFYQYLIERNIINLDYIDSYLKELSKETRNQRIKKWINSNLRKYLLNNHDEISQINSWNSRFGKKASWFDKALERGDKLYEIKLSPQFKQKIDHILDYFEANPNLGLRGITVSNALKQSDEWVEILNDRVSKEEGKIEEIEKDGSFTWVKVLDDQALNREGKLMQHCVGKYADKVRSRQCEIYSLRDSKNGPHATIEIIDGKINQIKGKQNAPVVKKYMPFVKRFVKRFGVKSQKDLIENGLIEINGIIYNINEIPENLTVNGDLDLAWTRIRTLPIGLKIKGNLNLFRSYIKKLPDKLEVRGDLDLRETHALRILPIGLKVGGNVYLFDSNIEKLPANLEVGGKLDLAYTFIHTISKGVKVKGDLTLYESKIYTILDDLEVGRDLDLSFTKNLKSLPKGLKVGGNLRIYKSNIEKLSDGLKVGGNLSIYKSNIEKLPDGLEIGIDLRLSHTKNLKSLPKRLKVGGNLILVKSNIKEIPDDAIIKGKIIK